MMELCDVCLERSGARIPLTRNGNCLACDELEKEEKQRKNNDLSGRTQAFVSDIATTDTIGRNKW